MKNMKFWRTALVAALVLTVMLSVTGGTIAWFTDTVESKTNTIQAGNLDIELEYKTKWEDSWTTVDENVAIFDDEALYEPGYTQVVYLKIKNAGTLAAKYNLDLKINEEILGKTKDGEDIKLSDYLVVGAGTVQANYGMTLDEWMGYAVAQLNNDRDQFMQIALGESAIYPVDGDFKLGDTVRKNQPIMAGDEQGVILVVAMPTTVGNEANHDGINVPSIKLGVNLEATQYTYEPDSFGPDYDEDALYPSEISTADDLAEALAAGKSVKLAANIVLAADDAGLTVPAGAKVTIDLNGHDITQQKVQTAAYALIANKGVLTIMDSVGTGVIRYEDISSYTADPGWASNTIRNEGVLNIKGGTVENITSDKVMSWGYPHAIDAYQGSVTNISGGTVKSLNYDSIRMFCNSDTLKTEVNISGGHIINRVTFQDPAASRAGYGVLNITGGTFTTTDGVNANVRLLNFSNVSNNMKATITGGTFDKGAKTQDIVNSGITRDGWLKVSNGVVVADVQ